MHHSDAVGPMQRQGEIAMTIAMTHGCSRNLFFATTIYVCLAIGGSAQAGPNSPSVSAPRIGNISNVRPDFSVRSRDPFRNVETGNASSNDNPAFDTAKKKKKSTNNANAKKKGVAAAKALAVPAASTPPVSGANLGQTPAGRKIEGLQGKIGIESLDAVQGVAKLPGALDTPDGGIQGLPASKRDPAGVGPAMNLPSKSGQASDGIPQVEVRDWVTSIYRPRGRSEISTRPTQTPSGGRGYIVTETWDLGSGVKVALTDHTMAEGGFAVTETRDGQVIRRREYDQEGRLDSDRIIHGDGTRTTTTYATDGTMLMTITTDRQGNVVSAYYNPDYFDPSNSAGGDKRDSRGETTTSPAPTGNANASGNAGSGSGNSNSSNSGNTNSNQESSRNSAATDRPDRSNANSSHESAHREAGGGRDNSNTGNDTGPGNKNSSQPVEGAASNRDFFGEMGVTHPGGRPKQTARGSDDRNIPDPSGIVIQRDPAPTPEELKAAVTQPGLGDAQRTGGGGHGGRNASDFAQPPAGPSSGVNSTNPGLSGSGAPGSGGGLVIPDPSGPAQ